MIYIKLDGLVYPYTMGDFRKDNPQVMIRDNPPAEILEEYGVYPVAETEKPQAPVGFRTVLDTPVFDDVQWVQAWKFEPAPVPSKVSMRQARLALLGADILDDVEAAFESLEDPLERKAAKIEWEYATEVQRTSPLIESLGPLLGLTEAQIDGLFHQAARIQ